MQLDGHLPGVTPISLLECSFPRYASTGLERANSPVPTPKLSTRDRCSYQQKIKKH